MNEGVDVSGAGDWEKHQSSKAGKLEDALNHPNSLLMGLTDSEKISAEKAGEAKEQFMKQVREAMSAPDHGTIIEPVLHEVLDEAETTNWESRGEVRAFIDFVRGFLDSEF